MANTRELEQRWRKKVLATYILINGIVHLAGDFDHANDEYITVCMVYLHPEDGSVLLREETTATCMACLAEAL